MGVMQTLLSPRGLSFDRYLVRYCGYSLLNHAYALQQGIKAHPALLLRTLGRSSGVWREAVLPYFRIEGKLLIVGSLGGLPEDPQWARNLRVHPQAEIFLKRRLQAVNARFLEDSEWRGAWGEITRLVPEYVEYQARCQEVRQIPVIALQSL